MYLLIAAAIALGLLFLLPTQSPTCFSFTSPRGTSFDMCTFFQDCTLFDKRVQEKGNS